MIVGVPREVKQGEERVALTPAGAHEIVRAGSDVLVETAAGAMSHFADEDYRDAGAQIVATPAEVFGRADLVVKVKEPQDEEFPLLREGQILFTYLHLAAYPEVARRLMDTGVTAIGYETVETADGRLPLLAPMSEIAGRMAVQAGAHFLQGTQGGRGVLLGGVPGVAPGDVVVLGAGNVGANAVRIAVGMGARVTVLDIDHEALVRLDSVYRSEIATRTADLHTIEECVQGADLLIGAVLVHGGRAPELVSEDTVRTMRPRSVIVDVAVDQGGCVATTHETSHAEPVYVCHDVVHYAVGNMPGAVPRTSTFALTSATLPYVVSLSGDGLTGALEARPQLRPGVQIIGGSVTCANAAAGLGLKAEALEDVWPGISTR